jgi:hypothetical protein
LVLFFKKEQCFFFEKKKQKTFAILTRMLTQIYAAAGARWGSGGEHA